MLGHSFKGVAASLLLAVLSGGAASGAEIAGRDDALSEATRMVGIVSDDSLPDLPIAPASDEELARILEVFSKRPEKFTQTSGAEIFEATCRACHMARGEGANGAGMHPPLAGNPKLISAPYVAGVLLTGFHGMPRFGDQLDDAQIAAVTNFIRHELGNDFPGDITAAEVAALRAPGEDPAD